MSYSESLSSSGLEPAECSSASVVNVSNVGMDVLVMLKGKDSGDGGGEGDGGGVGFVDVDVITVVDEDSVVGVESDSVAIMGWGDCTGEFSCEFVSRLLLFVLGYLMKARSLIGSSPRPHLAMEYLKNRVRLPLNRSSSSRMEGRQEALIQTLSGGVRGRGAPISEHCER